MNGLADKLRPQALESVLGIGLGAAEEHANHSTKGATCVRQLVVGTEAGQGSAQVIDSNCR